MWTTAIATALMIAGAALLVLGTLPIENKMENDTLTVKFIIGKKVIDIAGAEFLPVPDDVNHNIWRVKGTSIGRIRSGHFKNSKTGNRYIFYLIFYFKIIIYHPLTLLYYNLIFYVKFFI
jgi:hypothetical protein